VVERLRRYGISVRLEQMTAPRKDAAFGFLRGRLNEGSIELYEHPDLVRELRSVRTRYAAGRSSVVLPRVGGSHGDLAQALAISVLEHDKHGLGGGPAYVVQSPFIEDGSYYPGKQNKKPKGHMREARSSSPTIRPSTNSYWPRLFDVVRGARCTGAWFVWTSRGTRIREPTPWTHWLHAVLRRPLLPLSERDPGKPRS
jgi:hypothetical protein